MANNDMRTPGLDDPESILDMRRRHLSIALRMQRVAVAALEELEQKLKAGKPLGVSTADAQTLFDAGAQLERDALGGKESANGAAPKAKKPN